MYLLFEVGGTKTRIGFSPDGRRLENTQLIPTSQNFDEFITTLKDKSSISGKIDAVCGGMAVVFDRERSVCIDSAHLREWINKPVKEELRKAFGIPVYLENETALGGLGESVFGAGKDRDIVVFVTVGTGVGGVKIVKGKLDINLLGFEPGHQIIIPDGDLCSCGGKGHLEVYVAGSYFESKYHQRGEDIKDPTIWDQVAKHLAIGLHNTIVHWSPEIIILGGAVMQSIPLERVKTYLRQFSTIFPQIPEIKPAALGNEAGLYGALTYLNQQTT